MNMITLTNSLYSTSTRPRLQTYFFSERVIAPWNNLPATADNFWTFSSFKRFLNSTDLTMYVGTFWILN